MTILLDTNALIWFEISDARLGMGASNRISNAARDGEAFICPISFWEVELAIQRKRIMLTEPIAVWRRRLLNCGFVERPVVGEDTIAMAQLAGFHADPADRLIVAVAVNAGLSLVTSDEKILTWTGVLSRIDARN